jgi:hypothetical protein
MNRPRTPDPEYLDPENQQWWEPLKPQQKGQTWSYPSSPPPCKCWWTGEEWEPTEEELLQRLDYLRERKRHDNQRHERGE